jgi:hypothetical protein
MEFHGQTGIGEKVITIAVKAITIKICTSISPTTEATKNIFMIISENLIGTTIIVPVTDTITRRVFIVRDTDNFTGSVFIDLDTDILAPNTIIGTG